MSEVLIKCRSGVCEILENLTDIPIVPRTIIVMMGVIVVGFVCLFAVAAPLVLFTMVSVIAALFAAAAYGLPFLLKLCQGNSEE